MCSCAVALGKAVWKGSAELHAFFFFELHAFLLSLWLTVRWAGHCYLCPAPCLSSPHQPHPWASCPELALSLTCFFA